jgi:iron complex outermembrane receptor protein
LIGVITAAVLWVTPLSGQGTGTVRGRVTDGGSGQPIAGATVQAADRGALTQADGRFVVTGVPVGVRTVKATMLGYADASQAVTVAAGQILTADFALTPEAVALSQLVVVGYGQQRAKELTTSVTQVTPSQFNTGRVVSPEQLIESKVAGVQVVDNNEPGGGITIRIRGATSVNASSDPLYVIDGVPVGTGSGGGTAAGRNPLNFLNPQDIASVTVLKDAAAAAIYGANAANGVVMITTKSARRGTQIEYTGSMSGSQVTRLPSMLNASQFRAAVTQYAPQNVSQLGAANTSWFDQVDRMGFGQDHNLAISSATDNMNYRLSFGYLNQKGVIDGTQTERISAALNYDQRFFKDYFNLRGSLKGSRMLDNYTPGGVISQAAQMGPTQPVMDASNPTGYYEWPGNTLQSADNPVAILHLATDQGTTYRSIGNVQGELRMPFLQALKANVNLGYDLTRAQRQTFSPSNLHSQLKSGTGGNAYQGNFNMMNTLLDAYLNYAAPLKYLPGAVDITGGYSYSESNADYPYASASKLSTNLLGDNSFPGAGILQFQPNVQDSKLISFFGRANYNYNDKYLIAASVRRDGSSRFGTDNAWGVFPSVALAWRLSQEPLLKPITGLFSELKLRGSWGKTGNQAFGNYQYLSTYTIGDAQTQYPIGGSYVTTIRPSAYDPNIKWEATASTDIGLDYGIGNGRFSGAVDVYRKKTTDLIFTVPVAAGTTLSNFLTTNIGSMENKGFEFSLNAQVLRGGPGRLSWSADFNASRNMNKLLSINPYTDTSAATATQILTGSVAGGVGTFIQVLEPGSPVNSFFVYRQNYTGGKPKEADYADLNKDGNIGVADRRPFHSPDPKWMIGHTSSLSYGNIDGSFTLRAYLGNWVYNNVASTLGTYSEVGRASPYNLQSSVLLTGFTHQQLLSDYYVEDGSFLRMDNATLGYTFRYRDQPLRVFATVQNAFTMTGYSGVDPTAGLNGLDNNIYPRSRTFSLGVTAKF